VQAHPRGGLAQFVFSLSAVAFFGGRVAVGGFLAVGGIGAGAAAGASCDKAWPQDGQESAWPGSAKPHSAHCMMSNGRRSLV